MIGATEVGSLGDTDPSHLLNFNLEQQRVSVFYRKSSREYMEGFRQTRPTGPSQSYVAFVWQKRALGGRTNVQPSLLIFCLRKNVHNLNAIRPMNFFNSQGLTLIPLRWCKGSGFFKNEIQR